MIDLTLKQRLDLFGSNLAATLGIDKRVPITLSRVGDQIIVELPGRKISIPSAGRWHRYKRGWEPRTARLAFQFGLDEFVHLKQGDTVIDIGANIGEFSAAAAQRGATVYAIEGDPKVFECLEYNMKVVGNVHCLQHVIWKEDARLTFFSEPSDANSSVFKPDEGMPSQELTVDAVSLDSLADRVGITEVALLKCDAEGAEPEVIEGAKRLLGRTRAVAFDTGAERMGEETSDACEALLKDYGFRVVHDRRPNRKITFGFRD